MKYNRTPRSPAQAMEAVKPVSASAHLSVRVSPREQDRLCNGPRAKGSPGQLTALASDSDGDSSSDSDGDIREGK